jgi:hypothetical protein
MYNHEKWDNLSHGIPAVQPVFNYLANAYPSTMGQSCPTALGGEDERIDKVKLQVIIKPLIGSPRP